MTIPSVVSPRAAAKRRQILDGARRLFLNQGYAATATDAIAAAAGVSKQTLYAYFPNKETLFTAVLQLMLNPDAPGAFPSFPADDVPTDLPELRRELVDLARRMISGMMQPDYLALMRIIFAEGPRQPTLADLVRTTLPERGVRAVTALIDRAAARGLVVAPDPEIAARLFVGPLLSYAILDGLLVVDGRPRPPSPGQIEAIVDLFLRAIA